MPTSGARRKFWIKEEATYDTQQAIAATDGLDAVDFSFKPKLNLVDLVSHIGTGSHQGEFNGSTGGEWQLVVDIAPAAAGTAPDVGPALKATFGDETIVGGTSVTYDFNDSDTVTSLQGVIHGGDEFYEVATGMWVDSLIIEAVQNAIPRFTFTGGFAGYGCLRGAPTTTGTNAIGATTINLTTNHGYKLAVVGASPYVQFNTNDNGGAGYKVTAVTASTITITPGIATADVLTGAAVKPFVPSQTLAGTRLSAGTGHGLTIDSASIGMTGCKYTIAPGIKALDKQSTSSRPTRIFRTGGRRVTFDIDAYFLDEGSIYLGAAFASTQVLRDVAARLGPNTAAARCTLNTDKTLFEVQDVQLPDAEVAMMKLVGRARQNAAANDEFSLVFD